jgi:hypothetical protein
MWGITRRSHHGSRPENGAHGPSIAARPAVAARAPAAQPIGPAPAPMPGPELAAATPAAIAPALLRRAGRAGVAGWLSERAAWALERRVPWHRLPRWLALVDLLTIRGRLRRDNLHDAGRLPSIEPDEPPPWRPEYAHARSPDGTYNDLGAPRMGACGARFGRNLPLDRIAAPGEAELMTPSPREVSRRLLTRRELIPATTLNTLAAAWIQFETHDWFSHGDPDRSRPYEVALAADDPWPERPMKIGRTPADPTCPAGARGGPPTSVNRVTHWWDASQVYGSDEKTVRRLRSGQGGQLALTERGELPVDPATGIHMTGFNDNWWVGLYLVHTLFAREHNAICDRLRAHFPRWSDDELFDHARLVNAALIAKIHTVEWTTAILGHPALQIAMRGNWWGLATERIRRLFGRLADGDLVSGIPGSTPDHHAAPYAITEEFVSVYRMHPLLPDEMSLRSAATGEVLESRGLTELVGRRARDVVERVGLGDLLYSFGVAHPGALTLHNYPHALQQHRRDDGVLLDVGAVDILRDRERGVPRYNAFRRAIGLPPATDFERLCGDATLAGEMRDVYGGDIDAVDLLIGLLAERPPAGFGFSDTAFRIFILMASRRLKSDRFFTTDFTPECYTAPGLAWIEENSMVSVLLRHCPELAPALRHVPNAFAPWRDAGG